MKRHWVPVALIVIAILLGLDLGLLAGQWAGVATAFAGILPAAVWEIAIKRHEQDVDADSRRIRALQKFRLRRTSNGGDWDEAIKDGAARYLRPEEQVVSFRPRPEKDELYRWCKSTIHAGIKLVVGEAGVGKTRLAVQIAEDLKNEGWQDMWVERGQEREVIHAVKDMGSRAIIFVDYAETKGSLGDLLTDIANYEQGPDIRIVLLARSESEWWRQLIKDTEYRVARLVSNPIHLKPLTTKEGRQEVYDDAVADFAEKLGASIPRTELTLADADRVFLVVHAAALTAVLDNYKGLPGSSPRTANDVLNSLLEHEARYWHKTAVARNLALDDRVERTAVAAASLFGAGNEDRASRMLSNIPDLAGSPELCGRVARWLNDLYPGARDEDDSTDRDWISPLRPDRIAEHLIVEEFHWRINILERMIGDLSDRRILRALTILASAAVNDNRAMAIIQNLLESNFTRLAVPAVKVAVETNPAIAEILNRLLVSVPVPVGLLERIAGVLPYPTLSLGRAGVIVFKQLADQSLDGLRAERLLEVGRRLARLRQLTEALDVTQEAVIIYRALAAANPVDYSASLARSLNAQSVRLYQLGRLDEALYAVDESIEMRRILTSNDPDENIAELAKSLNNASLYLAEMEHIERGWEFIEESVRLYRTLNTDRAGLAMSLHSISRYFAEQGRLDDALKAMGESVDIHRDLVQHQPDMFLPQLASSLNNQAVRMVRPGRTTESIANIEETAGVERDQVRSRPRPFLIISEPDSMDNNAERHLVNSAVGLIEESVAIYEKLARDRPQIFLSDYATALSNKSLVLADSAKLREAAELAEDAIRIYRELHWDDLGLAMALHARSTCAAMLGQPKEALKQIIEAVSIYHNQAKPYPGALAYSLALALNHQSLYLAELGRLDEAIEVVEEAESIHREWADARPEIFTCNFIISLRIKSRHLLRRGSLEQSLMVIDEVIRLYRKLPRESPIGASVQLDEVLEERAIIASIIEHAIDTENDVG